MENAGYTTLTRQAGLLREMQVVANNIANMATAGFRSEGVVFSEFIQDVGAETPSLSMANGAVGRTNFTQGAVKFTGRDLDFAIEGPGFFMVETPAGPRLTRAGHFTTAPDGSIAAPDGALLLDQSGSSITIPPDATSVALGQDGTVSIDGIAVTQVGLWSMAKEDNNTRSDGVRFAPTGEISPIEAPRISQGALEASNVNPVREMARMIEIQRAYELGQGFLDRDDERVRSALRTLTS